MGGGPGGFTAEAPTQSSSQLSLLASGMVSELGGCLGCFMVEVSPGCRSRDPMTPGPQPTASNLQETHKVRTRQPKCQKGISGQASSWMAYWSTATLEDTGCLLLLQGSCLNSRSSSSLQFKLIRVFKPASGSCPGEGPGSAGLGELWDICRKETSPVWGLIT